MSGPKIYLGLINVGNTCFLNAVLQSLASVRSFGSYLRRARSTSNIANALISTFEALEDNKHKENPIVPHIIENSGLEGIQNKFVNGAPQDAHEFMQYLLECLDDEATKTRGPTKISDIRTEEKFISRDKNKNIKPVINPFVGLLRSTLCCQGCKTLNSTYQNFVDLSLSIPRQKTYENIFSMQKSMDTSLEDCLDYFTETESIPGVMCGGRCNKSNVHSKQLTIGRAPQTLCLHIRRLTGSYQKINDYIQFKNQLDLTKYCSFGDDKIADHKNQVEKPRSSFYQFSAGSVRARVAFNSKGLSQQLESEQELEQNQKNSSLLYQLVSVIAHHGDPTLGHYVVYRKCKLEEKRERWVFISDEKSKWASEEEVLKAVAYMLYYERR